MEFDAILICTGRNSKPHRPFEWRWEKKFKGRIIHAQNFKSSYGYHNKVVLIVGFGNSAVDCASALAGVAKQVYLSTRRGSWLLPQQSKNGGAPWDLSYNTRFSYLGRKVIPKYLRNWLWEMELNERFDHSAAGVQPKHRFLSANFTFSNDLPRHLTNGRVKIKPNILSFTDTGVEFTDQTIVEQVDEVILCTGYKFEFPFLEEGKLIFIRENDFHLYKHMFLPDLSEHNNLALIGFVQPRGPIFPVVEMQSRFFFHTLSGLYKLPSPFEMKRVLEEKRCDISLNYLKTHRHTQVEDYIEYMDDLASAIEIQPRLQNLAFSNPKLAIKCFFGPTTSYQFRLNGTHSWQGASQAISHVNKRMFPNGTSNYPSVLCFYLIMLALIYLIYAIFFPKL
uniref:Flavin-containing monooxygenase n=1 Tax=Acrobeloides nanus TaxID=290746 RepID=A0A914DRV3_9BILA